MQVAVILYLGGVGEFGAHAVHLDRLGARYLAHDIDIMHAAIDDRGEGLHQIAVPNPRIAARLLIEIHVHDEQLAEALGTADEFHPGRVDTEDIADHQLFIGGFRHVDNLLRIGDVCRQRLLGKNMAARIERLAAEIRMGVGVGVDRDDVRLGFGQGLAEIGELGISAEFLRQLLAVMNAGAAQADEFEAVNLMIGQRMAPSHIADAEHQYFMCTICHDFLSLNFFVACN